MSGGATAPAEDARSLVFEFLVDGEEMFDFAAEVGKQLRDGGDLVVQGIVLLDGEDFLVRLGAVNHAQEADGADLDEAAAEGWLFGDGEDIERVAVLAERAGNETVIAGIVHRRIEKAVEAEHAEGFIVFIFVAGIFGDFDDHADDFGRARSGIDFVDFGSHGSA